MPRRNRNTSAKVIERRLKEGRGQGTGREYTPWLNIQDVASLGQLNRVTSHTVGREHQLLSQLEYAYLLLFDWAPNVIDIREQFPLLPLESTEAIALELEVEHPKDVRTRDNIVMTTDFVITIKVGEGTKEMAIAVKYSEDLEKPRIIEKLELERRYWQQASIAWRIATEKDIKPSYLKNLQLLHPYHQFQHEHISATDLETIASELDVGIKGGFPITKATMSCDRRLGLQPGTSLAIVYHLITQRRWKVDLLQPINPSKPLSILS